MNESIIKVTIQDLGECDKFHSNSNTSTITGRVYPTAYIAELEEAVVEEENDWVKEQTQNRIDRMTTGISTIYVGGASDVEQVETKERVDDAVNACKLALESGVVIGGGATLWRYAQQMQTMVPLATDVRLLFQKAMETPLKTIVENAGADLEFYTIGFDGWRQLKEANFLYVCGKTGELEYAKDDGVLDPMQVVLNSVESAVSIAALVLMTDCAIVAPKQ